MPSPLLQLRIPQDLADWLESKFQGRGEVAEYVRQLLTAEQMKEATAPLVPEIFCNECGDTGICPVCRGGGGDAYRCEACDNTHKCSCRLEPKRVWMGTAAEWAAFQEGAGFETPEETEILDRMHGITEEEVSVAQQAEQPSPKRQVRGSKPRGGARKGSPDERSVGSEVEAKNESARVNPESPSSKPRKPKTCTHSNTIRKLGQPFCTDCGEFV